jgi:hypothetical protein
MAWMPLTLSCKHLAWDGTQQPTRHQLLMPPAQPTKNRAKAIHTHHPMLTIKCLLSISHISWDPNV